MLLVAHSGAGLLVPAVIGEVGDRVRSVVLVDTPMPPASGTTKPAPPWLLDRLAELADTEGVLPKWSQWWGEGVMEGIVPDPAFRAALDADTERLPLAYFDEDIAVPAGWADRPSAYVQCGPANFDDAEAAAALGWPVEHLDGTRLDIATRPDVVAPVLRRLLGV